MIMTARELDDDVSNGFYTANGESWHGRCLRCMLLEILEEEKAPEGFSLDKV